MKNQKIVLLVLLLVKIILIHNSFSATKIIASQTAVSPQRMLGLLAALRIRNGILTPMLYGGATCDNTAKEVQSNASNEDRVSKIFLEAYPWQRVICAQESSENEANSFYQESGDLCAYVRYDLSEYDLAKEIYYLYSGPPGESRSETWALNYPSSISPAWGITKCQLPHQRWLWILTWQLTLDAKGKPQGQSGMQVVAPVESEQPRISVSHHITIHANDTRAVGHIVVGYAESAQIVWSGLPVGMYYNRKEAKLAGKPLKIGRTHSLITIYYVSFMGIAKQEKKHVTIDVVD